MTATVARDPALAVSMAGAAGVVGGVFAAVLMRPVEPDDDFFELGGHSMMAIKAVIRLGQRFGCELPVRLLFDNPTPAGLARAIERRLGR